MRVVVAVAAPAACVAGPVGDEYLQGDEGKRDALSVGRNPNFILNIQSTVNSINRVNESIGNHFTLTLAAVVHWPRPPTGAAAPAR